MALRQIKRCAAALLRSLNSMLTCSRKPLYNETASPPVDRVTELITRFEELEVQCHTCFDNLITDSNRMTASYHKLVEEHGECERWIKDLTASGVNANRLTALGNQKAEIEREMIDVEDTQTKTWEAIKSTQNSCK